MTSDIRERKRQWKDYKSFLRTPSKLNRSELGDVILWNKIGKKKVESSRRKWNNVNFLETKPKDKRIEGKHFTN